VKSWAAVHNTTRLAFGELVLHIDVHMQQVHGDERSHPREMRSGTGSEHENSISRQSSNAVSSRFPQGLYLPQNNLNNHLRYGDIVRQPADTD
jgi:hypothetical protein